MGLSPNPLVNPLGESALLVTLGSTIDPELNRRVHALVRQVRGLGLPGIRDLTPGYASLLVSFDPLVISTDNMIKELHGCIDNILLLEVQIGHVVEIPVRYGGKEGPDLEFIAAHSHISSKEVIQRHTAPLYPVYFIGFQPGFPYLGGLDPVLACPRLEDPREYVPAGSVGIAGGQTGIYPLATPGGWRIIGQTDVRLFNADHEPPVLLSPGDRVHFYSVDRTRGHG